MKISDCNVFDRTVMENKLHEINLTISENGEDNRMELWKNYGKIEFIKQLLLSDSQPLEPIVRDAYSKGFDEGCYYSENSIKNYPQLEEEYINTEEI